MARVNILLSEESSSAQMGRLARNEMYFGRQVSPRETLAAIEAVTLEDVQSAAREMFDANLVNVAAIGRFPKRKIWRSNFSTICFTQRCRENKDN